IPIEDFLPRHDAVERHETLVHAPPDRTWAAVRALDMAKSPIVRVLFTLRGLPGREATLASMESFGFTILRDGPDEILLGLIGRFWRPAGDIERVPPADWSAYAEPVRAKAVLQVT